MSIIINLLGTAGRPRHIFSPPTPNSSNIFYYFSMSVLDHLLPPLWSYPEVRVCTMGTLMFTCVCISLYFIFRIMGKGKVLIWMMFWTVVQTLLVAVSTFGALLCLGMLLTEFTNHGLEGMFPSAIRLYHEYVSMPFIYNWASPLQQLQSLFRNCTHLKLDFFY